ncbi:MAG: hypothetical protein LKF53_02305 [Solobacterium sp.]|nr:hypothetical protein [Solobacterium sp.]MCH4205209.1 hypothetical protein [Solobacterium sp.]MCH4226802.1 hypothetical protein [Solobacterium sp.]MCH4281562.1 hypothetical protein [Solobacterium sp.]
MRRNTKRLRAPQARLKRAVAYRHIKYAKAKRAADTGTVQVLISSGTEEIAAKPAAVQTRKEKKNEWAEVMVSQPNVSLKKCLFHPLQTIEEAAKSEYLSLSVFQEILLNLFAWMSAALSIACLYAHHIEKAEYSIARYNFTDTCWLAVRIAIFCFAVGYLGYALLQTFAKYDKDEICLSKVMEIDALTSVFAGVLMLISAILILAAGDFGIAVFLVCAVAASAVKQIGLSRSTRMPMKKIGLLCFAMACIFLVLYYIFYLTALSDLAQIYTLL